MEIDLRAVPNYHNVTNANSAWVIDKHRSTEPIILEDGLLFRLIFENAAIGIALIDLEGRLIEINPAFLKLFGYNQEELHANRFSMLFHPDEPQSGNCVYHDMPFHDCNQYQIEKRFICKDGQVIWGWLTVSLIRRPILEPHFFIAMIEDITKRKQMEEALIAEKKRLAITLGSIGDGVIATDIDGNVVLMNEIAENLTGWGQVDALGKPIAKVFYIINKQTGTPYQNLATDVLKNGNAGITEDIVLVSHEGVERFISLSIAPIRNLEGKCSGTVLVFRDITEKQKMAEELIKKQRFESMAMLAGGIAHDFNNILAGILANAQLAKVLLAKGKDISKNLMEIAEAIKRATLLTKQLLNFAKGDALVKKATSIVELIKANAEFSLRGSNVKCEYFLQDHIWPVMGDEGQLGQVINNLIINAVQAMPEGGTLLISAENLAIGAESTMLLPKKNYVKITVKDTGAGIPTDLLSKIFDPYFTTKEKGSGLGLTSSYSIIKKHDGYIDVESIPYIGTVFYIYLPALEAKITPKAHPVKKIFNGKGKILLMDDEAAIRHTTKKILTYLGYKTVIAKDGAEVLELYTFAQKAGNPFDAVIMDLTIPGGGGGKETITKLKKIDPQVKAILSSGYANDFMLTDYHRYGFKGVMIKPYNMEELSATLHRVINESGQTPVKSNSGI
jgi:two-component system cell cycle sensor histidine kinase/response regulator CckA